MNLFITGTDTDVGKTITSAWICMHTSSAKYWKPLQTGNDSDSVTIKQLSPHTKILAEAYILREPLSPYNAAMAECIDLDTKNLITSEDKILIEGCGGVLVPICDDFFVIDLIKSNNAKALIVAKSKLGIINHLMLTVSALKNAGIEILGIVITGAIEKSIFETITKLSGVDILAVINYSDNLKKTLSSIPLPKKILETLG